MSDNEGIKPKKVPDIAPRELKAGVGGRDKVMIPDNEFFRTVVSDERLQRREFKAGPSHRPIGRVSNTEKRTGDSERPSLDPIFFLKKVNEFQNMGTEDKEKTDEEVGGMLAIDKKHVGMVRNLSKLTDKVREMVSLGAIGVHLGATIGSYPPGLHTLFADSLKNGKLQPEEFTTYGRLKAGKHKPASLKQRVISTGLVWPAELDPDGNPIEK